MTVSSNVRLIPILLCCSVFFAGFEIYSQEHASWKPPVDVSLEGSPPGDAVILFDGSDVSRFIELDGSPAVWMVQDGILTAGDHDIVSKDWFKDAQVHVEFNLPQGDSAHGNSGLYFHHLYEIQILDSHSPNEFTDKQQCASLFNVYGPLVNVTRGPGKWQSYDIVFRAARIDGAGRLLQPAKFTIFHNGVLVQEDRTLWEGTGSGRKNPMVSEGPLKLQSHGSPVRFRNIWIRRLKSQL